MSTPYNQHQDGDMTRNSRLLYGLGGGAIALFGLSRKSIPGLGLMLGGGAVAYRSLTGHWPLQAKNGIDADYSIRVNQAVTIARSPAELYSLWRDFERLPQFMSHLKSVQVLDDRRSHWVADAPLGRTVEWDAEIINDERDELIAWRSIENPTVASAGSVRFKPAPGDRGTEVHVKLEYLPPAGAAGALVAKIFQREPGQQIQDDLRRLKQILETGEVATTRGQPRGASKLVDAKERVYHEGSLLAR